MTLSLISRVLLVVGLAVSQLQALQTSEDQPTPQYFFGEFLVWYASEQSSSNWANATVTTVKNTGFVDDTNPAVAAFSWDYGFRVGAGRTLEYDQWDTQLYWTWFRTEAQGRIPTVDALINTVYLEFDGSLLHGDLLLGRGASIDWTLLLNMFDWELGRGSASGEALSVRPFIGLKGGWIDQAINAKIDLITSVGQEKLNNNFWGIGPSGGVDTAWEMFRISSHSLSFLGDFSTAMLWGHWNIKDVYTNGSARIPVKVNMTSLGTLMVRGFLGLGWNVHTCRYRFALTAGYEMQMWFNQLRIPSVAQLPLHGNLTLQGGTFNARFDF